MMGRNGKIETQTFIYLDKTISIKEHIAWLERKKTKYLESIDIYIIYIVIKPFNLH